MSLETNNLIPRDVKEKEKPLTISRVNPDDRDSVSSYYQFEVDQGFSKVHPQTTFEKMVDFRQSQIREGKLQVAVAKEGDQLVATSVVVLEKGTMGKEIQENEAYAAGTVVLSEKRSGGLGEKMAAGQERIVKETGKDSILTVITNKNHPSMRLRMKIGYRLEGIEERKDEVNFKYRKELTQESGEGKNWPEEVMGGRLKLFEEELNESSPDQILIDPSNVKQVKEAIDNNYQGVYLLRPKDFEEPEPIESNLIVFVRKEKSP